MRVLPQERLRHRGAGPDLSAARWLVESGVVATGSDTETYEVQPAPEPGVPSNPQPVHTELLIDHGIYINIVNVRGVYLPSMNTLALTVGAGTNHIVHELTHGFQDWMDVNADTNDIEADAHIAEQLSVSKLDPSYFASLKDDFSKAAGFILKNPGAAKFGNKDWSKMHKAASLRRITA